ILNQNLIRLDGATPAQNVTRDRYENAWSPTNPNGKYQRIGAGAGQFGADITDELLEDGSFFRLRTLTLSRETPASLLRFAAAALGLAAAAAGAAAGCNDTKYLTEQPYDFVGPSNFYQTSGDALAALSGTYAGLLHTSADNYYGRNFVMLVEYLTEMQTPYLS